MALTQLSCCRSVCSTCGPHGEEWVGHPARSGTPLNTRSRRRQHAVLYLQRRGVNNGNFAGPARDEHVLAVGRELGTLPRKVPPFGGRAGQDTPPTPVEHTAAGPYLERRRAPRHSLRPHQQTAAILQAPHNQLAARRVQHHCGSVASARRHRVRQAENGARTRPPTPR